MSETLTKSGLSIPLIGLGTWDMQGPACSEIVEEALEIGYRHIDGASMYENEAEVGKGVSDSGVDREEIFLTTKINTTGWTPSKGNGPFLQNKDIAKSIGMSEDAVAYQINKLLIEDKMARFNVQFFFTMLNYNK